MRALRTRLTQDDVCLLGLPFEQLYVIKTTIHKPDVWILACYLGALVTVAHETGNLIVWVGLNYRIESIAANVSCRPGTIGQPRVSTCTQIQVPKLRSYANILGAISCFS